MTLDGLPHRRGGADRRDDARRQAHDHQAHPADRRAGRAVARLATLPVPHQPHRGHRPRRGRAPPARRRRAHDPRSERPGTRALPLRPVQRQQRLDRDRLPRAQPRALDQHDRPARPYRPCCPHLPPPPFADPRPPDLHRPQGGHFTSPPAGPGRATSHAPSLASARCPPRPERRPPTPTIVHSAADTAISPCQETRPTTHLGTSFTTRPRPRRRKPPPRQRLNAPITADRLVTRWIQAKPTK